MKSIPSLKRFAFAVIVTSLPPKTEPNADSASVSNRAKPIANAANRPPIIKANGPAAALIVAIPAPIPAKTPPAAPNTPKSSGTTFNNKTIPPTTPMI